MSDYAVKVEMAGPESGALAVNELPTVAINDRGEPKMLTFGALSGAHVLHLAVAACVYNDMLRDARPRGIHIERLVVTATGDFTGDPLRSTGITYTIDVAGDAPEEALRALVEHVARVAEIPDMLRHGMAVDLAEARVVASVNPTSAD